MILWRAANPTMNTLHWLTTVGCCWKVRRRFLWNAQEEVWKAHAASPRLTTTVCSSASSWQQQLQKEIIWTRSSQLPGSQGCNTVAFVLLWLKVFLFLKDYPSLVWEMDTVVLSPLIHKEHVPRPHWEPETIYSTIPYIYVCMCTYIWYMYMCICV